MRKKIKVLLQETRNNYWDNISEEKLVPMTPEEIEKSNEADEKLIDKLIKLFES